MPIVARVVEEVHGDLTGTYTCPRKLVAGWFAFRKLVALQSR